MPWSAERRAKFYAVMKGNKFHRVHGHAAKTAESRTYHSWRDMRFRCSDPKNNRYHLYGGRGITVCARWQEFSAFLEDMGHRPEGKTLDRIDPNGNYEPSNCRWATTREQALNKRPRRRRKNNPPSVTP